MKRTCKSCWNCADKNRRMSWCRALQTNVNTEKLRPTCKHYRTHPRVRPCDEPFRYSYGGL